MKLSSFKNHLTQAETLDFMLPDGTQVPAHFHLTEFGIVQKQFIDCGGKARSEAYVSLQLWVATDIAHVLSPKKLIAIMEGAEKALNIGDLPVEVEYQTDTIGRYDIAFTDNTFVLTPKYTACLAMEVCTPGGGCC